MAVIKTGETLPTAKNPVIDIGTHFGSQCLRGVVSSSACRILITSAIIVYDQCITPTGIVLANQQIACGYREDQAIAINLLFNMNRALWQQLMTDTLFRVIQAIRRNTQRL